MVKEKDRRRRGLALETVILDATWAEFISVGYPSLTFDAVAKRSATSRTVIYRRWNSRAALAAAAIEHHKTMHPLTIPDLGTLREDLNALMRSFVDIFPPMVLRYVVELQEDFQVAGLRAYDVRFNQQPVQAIVDRAYARGELPSNYVPFRILGLPVGLLVREALISPQPITEQVIGELTDEIVLPLIRWSTAEAQSPPEPKGHQLR